MPGLRIGPTVVILATCAIAGVGCKPEAQALEVPTPGPETRAIFGRADAIVFAGGPGLVDRMDILVMSADGSDIACVACDELLHPVRTAPSWSPDGKAIAYATVYLGASPMTQSSIDVIFDDGHTVNLVLGPDQFEDPTWSPDGSEIAFTYRRRVGDDPDRPGASLWADPQICAVPVRPTGTPIPIGQMRCLTPGGWNDQADWSPDGSQLLYVHALDDDSPADIYAMKADGSDPVNLTNSPEAYEGEPAWSPDGRRIAFQRFDPELEQLDVWIMDADGSDPANLTPGPEEGRYPSWSPDGTRILFVTTRTSQPDQPWCEGGCLGYNEIYAMNADGSNPVNLTNDPQTYTEHPDWRPLSDNASLLPWLAGGGAGLALVGAAVWALRRRVRAGQTTT